MYMKNKEFHVVDFFLVLRRRRWILFATFILVVVTSTIGAYKKPEPTPKFQATATLVVKPDRPALPNIRGGAEPVYQEYLNEGVDQRTELHILKSRVMLEQVVSNLDPAEFGIVAGQEDRLINELQQAIQVLPIGGTYLVNIIATESSAQKAITLANTMAEVYIEYNLQTKLSSARKTLVWLNEQIVDLRGKVQDAYSALSQFHDDNKILSVEMSPESMASKLADLSSAYERAKEDRIEAETRLAGLRRIQQQGTDVDADFALTLNDPTLENLRSEIMAAQIERTNLLQSYKEKHPKVQQLDLKIQALRENLNKLINNLFAKFEADVSVLQAKENSLAQSVTAFKQDAIETNTKRLEYSKLKSEVASTEELYNLLFRQLKETGITENLVEQNTIRILEPAKIVQDITEPLQREQIIGFGVIVGLILGIGLAFLFEYFDKTIKNPEDVEQYLGLAVLGTIPKIDKNQKKVYGRSSGAKEKQTQYALEGGN